MKKDNKEISYTSKLTDLLSTKNPIYITGKGNYFDFIEIKGDKLFFSIPNHKKGGFYRKSISKTLLVDSLNKSNDDFKDLPFNDCRKSFFKAVRSIILSEK
jgi:hypothetical protein